MSLNMFARKKHHKPVDPNRVYLSSDFPKAPPMEVPQSSPTPATFAPPRAEFADKPAVYDGGRVQPSQLSQAPPTSPAPVAEDTTDKMPVRLILDKQPPGQPQIVLVLDAPAVTYHLPTRSNYGAQPQTDVQPVTFRR